MSSAEGNARKALLIADFYLPLSRNLVKLALAKKPLFMNSIARRVGAIAIIGAYGFYPQILSSNEFTGVQFAEWSEANQRGYISTQLVMASSIVTREKPAMSQCMAESFYDDNGLSDAGFEVFRSRISEFEAYHPSSVIVVVIENACGPFY